MFLQRVKQVIKNRLDRHIFNIRPIKIPINKCVHFCGFRYGCGDYNPFESYINDLHCNNKDVARKRFITFLQHYRPKTMSTALGVSLSCNSPLWEFPWNKNASNCFDFKKGWMDDPNDIPDIITHYSPKGILSFRIEEHFMLLENAYWSIKKYGYQPIKFNNFIEVLRFDRKDGRSAFLALDGNNRLTALSVLRQHEVLCIQRRVVKECKIDNWPGVKNNLFSHEDALKIFEVYFHGNNNLITTQEATCIIDRC